MEANLQCERRKSTLWIAYIQTLVLVVIFFGITMIVALSAIEAKLSHTYNRNFNKKIEDIIASHVEQTETLLQAKNKGYRFTAGNAWQLMQYVQHGSIDMSQYPPELKTACGTWYNTWLEKQGILKPNCDH